MNKQFRQTGELLELLVQGQSVLIIHPNREVAQKRFRDMAELLTSQYPVEFKAYFPDMKIKCASGGYVVFDYPARTNNYRKSTGQQFDSIDSFGIIDEENSLMAKFRMLKRKAVETKEE